MWTSPAHFLVKMSKALSGGFIVHSRMTGEYLQTTVAGTIHLPGPAEVSDMCTLFFLNSDRAVIIVVVFISMDSYRGRASFYLPRHHSLALPGGSPSRSPLLVGRRLSPWRRGTFLWRRGSSPWRRGPSPWRHFD